jgi:hypothetical protein
MGAGQEAHSHAAGPIGWLFVGRKGPCRRYIQTARLS